MQAELVFRGARLADGDNPVRTADVAVDGGRVTAVADRLPIDGAKEVVDASGLLLCPGFIDLHAHSALRPFRDPLLTAKVAQGFTTELICPDGLAPAPVTPARRDERRRYIAALEDDGGAADWDWQTLSGYLDALAATRPATTLVASLGHSAVRDCVVGPDDRRADDAELRDMREEVRAGLAAGARVLSFGLIYAPGLYAPTDELIALADVAAEYGVPLMPHVRNEASGVLTAIGEFVHVAEVTGAPLHVSHVKLVGSPHLLDRLLDLLTDAANRIDLTFDHYPYGAGSTLLSALLPPWAFDGGPSAMLARLGDGHTRVRMARDMERGLTGWENLYGSCGPENIVITDAAAARAADIGKTIAEIAAERGCEPVTAVLDLLTDADLAVGMIDHYATEEIVRAIFSHPLGLVGSDGIFNTRPHPRLYGTAARVLGRYALRDGLISVEEAVARLSSRAADRLGLADRGRVRTGLRADLVLLDPGEYLDTADYADPCRTPSGVRRVMVGGTTVYADGAHTGARPGGVIRTPRGGSEAP